MLRSVLAPVILLLTMSLVAPARAGTLVRDEFDSRELTGMRAFDPQAAASFEEADALALGGHLEEALGRYQTVKAAMPSTALPRRRICEVMTALGRGPEAMSDCTSSMQILRTDAATRAVVRALVGGPAPPTAERLYEALSILRMERRHGLRRELSSALCDVAESIGDGIMLQHCVRELLSVAPDAPETRRALARLQERCPPLRFWAGWLAILAAVVATAAHAVRERLVARAVRVGAVSVATAGVLAGLALLAPRAASALELPKADQRLSSLPLSDADPESSVPSDEQKNKDPLDFGYWLQDVIYKAEQASNAGNHESAIQFYRALVKAVPDRAVGYSKLCREYEALKDLDKATATCGGALAMEGVTTGDYAHYVHLVLAKRSLSTQDLDTLHEVVAHLRADPSAQMVSEQLDCEVGARTMNTAELKSCVDALTAKAPNAPSTLRYEWALAVSRRHFAEARAALQRARDARVDVAEVEKMERATAVALQRYVLSIVLGAIALGLLAATMIFGARYLASRRRPLGAAAQAI